LPVNYPHISCPHFLYDVILAAGIEYIDRVSFKKSLYISQRYLDYKVTFVIGEAKVFGLDAISLGLLSY
jgi:hypothetical protein